MGNQKAFFLAGLLSLLISFTGLAQTTKSWDGGGSTNNWEEAANWTGNTLPGVTDFLDLNRASIQVSSSFSVAGIEDVGTITLNDNAELTVGIHIASSSELLGNGSLIVTDSVRFDGGQIGATLVIGENASGVIRYNTFLLSGSLLQIDGNIAMREENFSRILYMQDSSRVINNGQVSLNTSRNFYPSGSINTQPRFINRGTLTVASGTGNFDIPLDNEGQVIVKSRMNVEAGVSDGVFTVEEGAWLEFDSGSRDLTGADFFGGGTIQFNSGNNSLTGVYNLDPQTGKTLFTNGITTFNSGMNLVSLGNVLEVNARSFSPELQLNTTPSVSPELIRLPNSGKLVLEEGVMLNIRRIDFISGTLRGKGTVSVSDTVDWPGGSLGGNLIIEENGYLKMGSLGNLDRRTMEKNSRLEINGVAEWMALQIGMADSSVITVNGTLEMSGSSFGNGITVNGFINKLGTVVNNGTIHHHKNTGAITARAIIENYGLIKLESLLRMQGETGNNNSFYAGGGVINQREGRIEGTGTIQFLNGQAGRPDESFFENYGTVAPGLSAGTFNWNNRFSAEPSATLEIELGGLEEGISNDLFESPNNVSLGGIIEIKFINGFVPTVGQKFRVMNYGSKTATFQQVKAPLGFIFEQNYVDGINGTAGYLELEVIKASDNPLDEIVFIHPTVEHLGHSMTMGDFNGDGSDDLAIAGLKKLQALKESTNSGFVDSLSSQFINDFEIDTIFVVFDASSLAENQTVNLSQQADVKLASSNSDNESFGGGNGALYASDLNGDNQDELLVGGLMQGTTLSGGVFIFDFTGLLNKSEITETDAFAKLRASDAGISYPEAIKTGDLSNNGFTDVIAGFPRATVGAINSGVLAFWNNTASGFDATQYINTNVSGDHLGAALDVGDVNGDGFVDLAVIAGGEIIENDLFKDLECVDRTFDGSAIEENYYSRVVNESNPGKGILIFGPITSGGNISTGFGDVLVNGQFRTEPTINSFSQYYATFSSTLLYDFNGDGKSEWYIGESFPRSMMRLTFVRELKEQFETCGFGSGLLAKAVFPVGRSVTHWFKPDDLNSGSTLDESDSFVSYAEAGRALIAAQLSDQATSKDLVFSGDLGEIRVQKNGPHDDIFIIGDNFDDIVSESNYSFDFAFGTEDTRLFDSFSLSERPYNTASGFGQTIASGFTGPDNIEDLLVGAPYYLPESNADPMGRVFLFRSDKPEYPPVVGEVSGIDSTGRWQFLGTPSTNEPYSSLLSTIWTQGATGASTPDGSPSVFIWNESLQDFEAVNDLNQIITNGKGLMAYVYEDDDPSLAGIQGGWPKSLVSEGDPKFGDAVIPVSYTSGPDSTLNGFNLVSNPYSEAIDWESANGWTRNKIHDAIYIWDGTENNGNGAYKQQVGGVGDPINIIAPLQGFFIQASDTGAVLSVTEDVKTTGGSLLKSQNDGEASVLEMNISTTDFEDNAYIVFRDEAEFNKDVLDAIELQTLSDKSVQLYSSTDSGIPLAINSLPKIIDEVIDIPLNLASTQEGDYTLRWDLNHFPDNWKFILTDLETGIVTDLKLNESYDFQVLDISNSKPKEVSGIKLKATSTEIVNRFTIQVSPGIAVSTEPVAGIPNDYSLMQNYPNPFNPSTVIDYSVPEIVKVNLTVYDMLGRKVSTLVNSIKSPGKYTVNFDASGLSSGIYIYRLNVGSRILTKKMTLVK